MKPEYIEIEFEKFNRLLDKSGYYKVIYFSNPPDYYKDGKLHNETGPARIFKDFPHHEYFLNNYKYGTESNYTNESWAKFAARIMKLRAFE